MDSDSDYDYDYRQNSTFEYSYRCYPFSLIEKGHLDNGDKIIMPPSALARLAYLDVDYPMIFGLRNPSADRVTHCGVLEFTADEGVIYLPIWMMKHMLLNEGDLVELKNASLSKGTYVKLQPHTKDFLDISNPKAILEKTLRNYSCLTSGDTIMIAYNNKQYYIDIVETKPFSAISIIETDCEVDFAAPLDYEEPEEPAPSPLLNKSPPQVLEELVNKVVKFMPFTGSARRLDGKPSTESAAPTESTAPAASSLLKPKTDNAVDGSRSSTSTSRRRSGKLVFGSTVNRAPVEKPKVAPQSSNAEPPQKLEEPKFQAFTGKKYSLRG